MIRIAFVLIVGGLALAAAPAWAQEPPPATPPVEAAPAEVAPAESNPAESKPAETRPTESKPVESKPAENKSAETPPADPADSRFTFSRAQDGYVRLDNRTGQVSVCSKRTVGWGCQLAPEDRIAFESEIARLQDENAALKKDLLARGLSLPGGVKSEPPLAQGDPAFKVPNDVERMKSYIAKLWGRLVDMIAHMQKDVLKKS